MNNLLTEDRYIKINCSAKREDQNEKNSFNGRVIPTGNSDVLTRAGISILLAIVCAVQLWFFIVPACTAAATMEQYSVASPLSLTVCTSLLVFQPYG